MADCVEYLTVSDVRAEFGDDVADDTDSAIQRRIDQMVGLLEDKLGHTFNRRIVWATSALMAWRVAMVLEEVRQ